MLVCSNIFGQEQKYPFYHTINFGTQCVLSHSIVYVFYTECVCVSGGGTQWSVLESSI